MTSFRQIAANRRNASKSTGPTSEEGKRRSRRNAVRHGLTAEPATLDALDRRKPQERKHRFHIGSRQDLPADGRDDY